MTQDDPPPKEISSQMRQERVIALFCEGNSITDISSKLQVSRSTICRDIKQVRERIMNNFQEKSYDNIISNSLLQLELVRKTSWKSFHQFKNESNRIGCLNTILKTVATELELLEKFGTESEMINGTKVFRRKNDNGNVWSQGLEMARKAIKEQELKKKEEQVLRQIQVDEKKSGY